MSTHDAFNHLKRSLFLSSSDLMSMLTICCDDSGTGRNDRSAVVAGYVSSVAQWEIFTKEWNKTLKEFGVEQMRRSDLENFQGCFKNWDPTRRKEFLQKIQPIIRRRTKLPIGTAVIKKDFEAVIPKELQNKFGGVYAWCAHTCLVKLRLWCDMPSRRHTKPIEWILEAGTIGQSHVNDMFTEIYKNPAQREEYHLKGWAFQGKDVVPLQAADVLAYELFKLVENQVIDNSAKHDVRTSARNLVGPGDGKYIDYWDRERLAEWVETHKSQLDQF